MRTPFAVGRDAAEKGLQATQQVQGLHGSALLSRRREARVRTQADELGWFSSVGSSRRETSHASFGLLTLPSHAGLPSAAVLHIS